MATSDVRRNTLECLYLPRPQRLIVPASTVPAIRRAGHRLSVHRQAVWPAPLPLGPTIPTVAVDRWTQPEVFAQSSTLVLNPKQSASPQFGNHHLDEILAAAR